MKNHILRNIKNFSFSNNDNNNNNNNNKNKIKFNSDDNRGNNNNNINNDINSNDNNNPRTSKQRKRNMIWFNPPFSKNVATKIGRYLFKHFPRDHKFLKIFNRNNIKVSYSCMPNIKSAINSHNRKILHPPVNSQSRTCNCIKKTDYPLQEKFLS